ncbi:hypothetical protein D3C80_1251560 [compost metagenome]
MGGGCEQPNGPCLLTGKAGMLQRFACADQVVENDGCLTLHFTGQESASKRGLITVFFHQGTAHRTSQLQLQSLTKLLGSLGATGVR